MYKKIIAALAVLFAATAFAAVDANRASQAELEAVKGIGPVISTLIIGERKKGEFKDWNDLVVRVKGVGDKSAEKFSEGGLTVNGKTFGGAAVAAKSEKAPTTSRASASAPRSPSATRAGADTAATAGKPGADKAASASATTVNRTKANVNDEKAATKVTEKAQDSKEARAEKKAEKARLKAEKADSKAAKAAAGASAPAKK